MLKVVIVDDETLVRVGLKSILNWEEEGYEIVGEENNGLNGLKLIKRTNPDIVITDIKMPGMDGIEMMQKALKFNKKLKFIVLSNYGEFHLVRQAMKLGARDYLLKLEIKPEVLTKVLSNIKDEILNELNLKDKNIFIENQISENKSVLRGEFFKDLISNILTDAHQIDKRARNLGIELREREFACAFIKVNYEKISENYSYKDMKLLDTSILNILEEISNEFFRSYAFKWEYGEYVIVLSDKKGIKRETFRKKSYDMAEVLIQMLKNYVNVATSVGISNLHPGYKNLSEAYAESKKAIEQIFYHGYGSVIYYSDLSQYSKESYFDLCKYKIHLLKSIEVCDISAVKNIFSDILLAFQNKRISKENAYDICCQLAYLTNLSLGEQWDLFKGASQVDNNIFESIRELKTYDEIINWIRNFEKDLCKFLTKVKNQHEHYLIAEAKRFIHENYMNNIGLNEVAEHLNLSPKYFSNFFKKNTGVNFSDYVTQIRMTVAKKLLKETNYKIYEIANLVGYENAFYFSKIFKKNFGVTPKEFIKNQTNVYI